MEAITEQKITEQQIDNLAYKVLEDLITEGVAAKLEDGHSLLGFRDDDLAVDLNLMLTKWFTARGIEVA